MKRKVYYDKVHYTKIGNFYRPYIEVFFYNEGKNKIFRSFALLDSGADDTLIPLSIGQQISLEQPSNEEFKEAKGISGNISLVKRKCVIYLINRYENKIYGFEETVS